MKFERLQKLREFQLMAFLHSNRLIQLGPSLIAVLLLITTLSTQNTKRESFMPVLCIATSRIDLYNGVYHELEEKYSEDGISSEFLTTSAIMLMTNLTSSLLSATPDTVGSTFNQACFTYRTRFRYVDSGAATEELDPFSPDAALYDFTKVTVNCIRTTFYDYRALLDYSGYSYMMGLTGTSNAVDDHYTDYQTQIEAKSKDMDKVPGMLGFVIASHLVTIAFSVWHTKMHQRQMHQKKLKMAEHAMAAWTFSTACIAIIACMTMTVTVKSVQKMIRHDYSEFGISLKLGKVFFGFIWAACGLTILTMTLWVGPIWCATPQSVDIDEEEEELQGGVEMEMEMEEIRRLDTELDEEDFKGMVNPFELYGSGSQSTFAGPSDRERIIT